MAPQLHLNILKRNQTPTNPHSPQRTPSTPSSPTASPKSSSVPASPNPSVGSTAIPNRDPLPLSTDALEGLLNACASQLQKLADRIESVNEWLEMDGIVLAKLVTDMSVQLDKEEDAMQASEEAVERAAALWKENNPYSSAPAASMGPVSPGKGRIAINKATGSPSSGGGGGGGSHSKHRRVSSGESRVPEVYLKNPFLLYGRKSKDERIDDNCSVRDLRQRIKAMMKWRRDIERTVCWQREEYRRVLKALHRESADESAGRSAGARRIVQFKDNDNDDEEGAGGGDLEGKGKGKEKEKGKGKGKGKEKEGVKQVKTAGVERDEGWGIGGPTWQKKRSVRLMILLLLLLLLLRAVRP